MRPERSAFPTLTKLVPLCDKSGPQLATGGSEQRMTWSRALLRNGEKLRVARIRDVFGKPVVAVNLTSHERREFPTATAAADALGLFQTSVSLAARKRQASAGGWAFFEKGQPEDLPTLFGHSLIRAKRDREVFGFNLETKERRSFRNCTAADVELGLHSGAASSVATRQRSSAGNWHFSFDKGAPPPAEFGFDLVASARSKPVIAQHLTTGDRALFPSAKAAATKLGVARSAISRILAGRGSSAKGWRFEWPDEDKVSPSTRPVQTLKEGNQIFVEAGVGSPIENQIVKSGESSLTIMTTHPSGAIYMDTDWFKVKMKEKKLSQRQLAIRMGLDHAAISLMIRGKRQMRLTEAKEMSMHLEQPFYEVLRRAGIQVTEGMQVCELSGSVGADGRVFWQNLGESLLAPADCPSGTAAIQVRCAANKFDGWVLFVDASVSPPKDHIGELCVVRLSDNREIVSHVRRGYGSQKINLFGWLTDESILDATATEARKVSWIKPA